MTAEATSENLVQRLKAAEEDISLAEGPFVLFALAERDEAPGKWDLLVSAEWLDINRKGIDQMVDALKPYLEPADWRHLASLPLFLPQWSMFNGSPISMDSSIMFWKSRTLSGMAYLSAMLFLSQRTNYLLQ